MACSTPGDSDMPPPKRRRTESFTSDATQHREVGIMRQERGRGASFIGSASGIHFVRSVYNAVGNASPEDARSSRHELVPGEEDQLPNGDGGRSSSDQLWRAGEVCQPASGHEVSFEDLVRWLQSYFDHWHPVLPFLNAPVFLEWCEAVSQRPLEGISDRLSVHQMVIVRSVFSTALMDRRQTISARSADPVPLALVFQSFHHAVTSVDIALVASPSVESLQAVMSVQLFLISMLRHNAASRIGGIILRLLFQMGMHRCPHRYSTFSQQDCIIRQRVFWSVYCLDRYICQSLGIPLTLRDDDIDVCMLDDEQHERGDERNHAMDPRLNLLCLCSRHSRIKAHVLELCNKSINYRNFDLGEVGRVQTMIAKWGNDIESLLDDNASSSPSIDHLHQLMLKVQRDEAIIALQRPLLTGERTSESYDSALQACISSSRSVIKSLSRKAGSIPLVWPSFTWAAWMSGFIVLYAAVEGELPLTVALSIDSSLLPSIKCAYTISRLADQCVNVLDHLSARDTIWPKTCAKVVRDLAERVRQSAHASGKSSSSTSPNPQRDADTSMDLQAGAAGDTASSIDQDVSQNGLSQDFFSNVFDEGPEAVDLFRGFDIPFWLGDDQYANMMNNGWA